MRRSGVRVLAYPAAAICRDHPVPADVRNTGPVRRFLSALLLAGLVVVGCQKASDDPGSGEATTTSARASASSGCPDVDSMDPALSEELSWVATQIELRERNGDHLAAPREVDHSAKSATAAEARAAAEELRRRGYRVEEVDRGLTVLHVSPVTEDMARSFVCEVYTAVAQQGGSYEGWGSFVVDETGEPLQ